MSTDNVSPKSDSLERPGGPASPPAPPVPGVLRSESCVGTAADAASQADAPDDTPNATPPTDTPNATPPTDTPDSKESGDSAGKDTPTPPDTPQVNLLTIPIENEQVALNVIIGFLGVAQRRGVFALNESAKIFECVQAFQKAPSPT